MKALKILSLSALLSLGACSSIQVASDYDNKTNFEPYKTYAFFKDGIDQAEISDLDKKRILTAIDESLTRKGFSKDDNPDFVINIFTKANQRVDIYNNSYYSPYYGYGYGWGPYWGPHQNAVSTTIEGKLFIDILDAHKKELIWQGNGTGFLTKNRNKKEALIQEFVDKVLKEFPPKN